MILAAAYFLDGMLKFISYPRDFTGREDRAACEITEGMGKGV